jgi:hypothetical protein
MITSSRHPYYYTISFALLIAAGMWGLFWIPQRALEAGGLTGGWATISQMVIPFAMLLPISLWRLYKGPGLLSADYLAESILEGFYDMENIKDSYRRKARNLIKETELSSKLFDIVERAYPVERNKILSNVPRGFWRDYFKAKLTVGSVVLSALKEPVKGLRLMPYLFRLF